MAGHGEKAEPKPSQTCTARVGDGREAAGRAIPTGQQEINIHHEGGQTLLLDQKKAVQSLYLQRFIT